MSIVRRPALAALLLLAALLAGCGASPGGSDEDTGAKAEEARESSKKIDVAKAGDVTLTVWDQEVRGGQRKQIERLNAAFQERYPNVTIKRVAKSFEDLNTTLKLAVSGDKAPDVVQANQGRPVMGQLVKGGLLRPLDAYAEAYGWADRYAEGAARPQPLLRRRRGVRHRRALRPLADGRDRRRLLQPRAGARAAGDVRRVRVPARARRRPTATSRSRSATSTAGPASTSSRPCRRSSPSPTRCATSSSRARARRSPRRRTSRPPPRSRTGPRRATSRPTSTAPATTRPGSSSRAARAAS